MTANQPPEREAWKSAVPFGSDVRRLALYVNPYAFLAKIWGQQLSWPSSVLRLLRPPAHSMLERS